MSAVELNSLNINGFVAEIARLPLLKYAIQTVTFPGVTLPEVSVPNPLQAVMGTGDHVVYDELSFDFIVDEKMLNYRSIYDWIRGQGFPNDYQEYANFISGNTGNEDLLPFSNNPRMAQFSDILITILTNHKNPQIVYRFKDAHPIVLSGFSAEVTNTESTPIVATVSFRYTELEILPA